MSRRMRAWARYSLPLLLLGTVACSGDVSAPTPPVQVVRAEPQVPAPVGLVAEVSGATAVVKWEAPAELAGAPSAYLFHLDDAAPVRLDPTTTTREVGGLPPGSQHLVQVVATTDAGVSRPAMTTFTVPYPKQDLATAPQQADPGRPAGGGPPPPVTRSSGSLASSEACNSAQDMIYEHDDALVDVIDGRASASRVGHSFGADILQLREIGAQATDGRLGGLISAYAEVLFGTREELLATGELHGSIHNFDATGRAVQDYCAVLGDPLAS